MIKTCSNLVSDDTTPSQSWLVNEGVTLPEGTGATYNAALPPLFVLRSGHKESAKDNISERGQSGFYWTPIKFISGFAYRFTVRVQYVWPSDQNNPTYGLPLRCLVSTNNG